MNALRPPMVLRISTILMLCVLVACSTTPSPTPSPTSLPPTPTSTPSPIPTQTATPSLTPTLTRTVAPQTPDPDIVQVIPLPAAGFSFLPLVHLHVDIRPMQVTLANIDQTFLLSLAAGIPSEDRTLEELLSSFLANMKAEVTDLEASPPIDTQVAGQPAIAADIRGTLLGDPYSGRITIALPESGLPLFALALSIDPPLGNGWEAEGVNYYALILASIQFFEPAAPSASCAIASDPTYGYEKSNPVKVGGGAMGGPSRERAYLDTLLGPGGQVVSYERSGSLSFGDIILDAYVLTYPGIASPVTLYIDEYNFDTLYAPVGFTCSGPFPVTPP